MKTILIFNEFERGLKFYVLDGDYRKYDGIYINSGSEDEREDTLHDMLYDEIGSDKLAFTEHFPIEAITRNPDGNTFVIVAGFLS